MDYMDISSIKFYQSYEDFETAKTKERIILATTKAKEVYTNFKFREDDTLLFGRESSGVPESLHKKIKYKIKIPMVRNKKIFESCYFCSYNYFRKFKTNSMIKMKLNLRQELSKQWFKNLQDIICKNIEEIENNKVVFRSKKWIRSKK